MRRYRPSEGAELTTTRNLTNRIRLLALLVVMAATLFAAAPARATTVGFSFWSGTLYYFASSGQANDVTISGDSSGYTVTDTAANLTASYGCTLKSANQATCLGSYVKSLYVNTGDGDDKLSLQSMTSSYVNCGTGTDTLNTPNTTAKVSYCELVNAPAAIPPATPAPTPPVAPLPPLAIGQETARMTQGGDVPLTLNCAATAASRCTGTIVFELPKKAKSSGVTASRRGAPNILGKDRFSVAQGKRRKVKISMTSKGRGMVKRRKRLRVTAKLKVKQGGKTRTTTQSLTIKAPRRH
jgi:hypothetical protein